MLSYKKIAFPQLKNAVRMLNETGFVVPTLRHVGVDGPELYDSFISTVESLTQEQKENLPENVIDFYNLTIVDEDEEQEPEELDFEDGSVAIEDDMRFEDEPELTIIDEEELLDSDVTPTPSINRSKNAQDELPKTNGKPKLDKKPELDKRPTRSRKKPVKRRKRLTEIVMAPKIVDKELHISFKKVTLEQTFTLPPKQDKQGLKVVRREAMEFAEKNGATKGQLSSISRVLNQAGYYVR